MYMRHMPSGDLVEVLDIKALIDPCRDTISGRFHAGEELQEPAEFLKSDLIFPSGESLPSCWVDPHYRGNKP